MTSAQQQPLADDTTVDAFSPNLTDSFRDLYAAHARSVYVTALAVLKDPDAAQDAVHDVFLRAWQQAGQYDPSRGSVGVWLRAIARNLSIDRLRASQRARARSSALSHVDSQCDESLDQLVAHEDLASLRRAFHTLSPMHRELIVMAYDRGFSHNDIAQRLHQPLGTIKSRIRQALALLRASARQTARATEADATSWLALPSQAFTTVETDPDILRQRIRQMPRLRVLVVDDDDETVKLVSAVLIKFRLHPETRTSAKDGLDALQESWPDVMIFDLNMPGEDGYSLIGKARTIARERGLRLRAAAFTSWSSELERSRALIAGFDLYINKPVHPLALISAVASLSH